MSKPIKISIYNSNKKQWIEYPSIVAAARKLNFSASNLVAYLNGYITRTSLSGFRFKVNGVVRNPAKVRNLLQPKTKKARKLDYRLIMRVNELMK
jgi:hypothetical protein